MRKAMVFLVLVGIAAILGSRAWRRAQDEPRVHDAVGSIKDEMRAASDKIRSTAEGTVKSAADEAKSRADAAKSKVAS